MKDEMGMTGEPLVSILVPVYGVEQYIERCARSLFEQSYTNLEYVFVNDCTPDRSMEVLEKVMEDYPRRKGQMHIFSHLENRGLAAVRNTLLEHCHGTFLTHVDSDDWIERDAVEQMMSKQREHDADIMTGMRRTYTADGVEEEKNSGAGLDKEAYLLAFLKPTLRWFVTNRLIRTSLYKDHGIEWVEGIDFNEDFLVMAQLLYYARRIGVVESFTYHYERRNENSYMDKLAHSWNHQEQVVRSHQLIAAFYSDKEPILKEASQRLTIRQYRDMMWLALENDNREGYDQIMRLLGTFPSEYESEIGWDNKLKKWLENHYHLARWTLPLRRLHGRLGKLKD